MAGYQSNEIQNLIQARSVGRSTTDFLEHLLIDSRKLVFPASTLFFAIKTQKRDGHQYIEELYRRGVRNFVVEEQLEFDQFPAAQFFLVNNVVQALQALAASHRKKFLFPVIGITGSNGKTIIKEWLNHLLQHSFNIVRSPRSYNSQLGVPLSIWQMDEANDLGIFEAGISAEGEMQKLQEIVAPTIGIFSNIGEAHSEGFKSIIDKLAEKLGLFKRSQFLVYCKDHLQVDEAIQQKIKESSFAEAISWGESTRADINILEKKVGTKRTDIKASYKNTEYTFAIPYSDPAAIENAMHCFAAAIVLGKADEVLTQMVDLPPLSMRLEIKEGQNQCTLINDSYNADLNGLLSALEFMGMQGEQEKRTGILSDLTGVVGDSATMYATIAAHLREKKVSRVVGIGKSFLDHANAFSREIFQVELYSSTTEFLKKFHSSSFRNEVILIKGARSFRFERISHLLERKVHQTRLEIDLAAITQNLKAYRGSLHPETGIMVMVKAFSYGAGSYEVANLLQFHRVEYLAVAYVDEGVELRKAGIRLPIMVMNTEAQAFPELLEYNLEPEIYSVEIANLFYQYLQGEGISHFPIHIKLDTGMHRLGFEPGALGELFKLMGKGHAFKVQSVFTHLVASEDPNEDAFTRSQVSIFDECCEQIQAGLGYSFLRHASNTAAISRHPNLQYDMVRLGIGLYGVDPGNSMPDLIESGTLKTTISQIKDVKAGESVGYGRKAILTKDARIATIRIGYADGYPRNLGNGKGTVWINGHLVYTVGNVCMDMTMVDITDYPGIKLDDEVVVFGQENSVQKLAIAAQTIPYEIMTGISQRVPRVYFGE